MANFANLRGPVGMNRVYARIEGELTPGSFLQALKQGRTFATNGPLLGFTLAGVAPGEALRFATPQGALAFSAHLKSIVPVDQLDIVCNGRVVKSLLGRHASASGDFSGTLPLRQSGWCLLRAETRGAHYPVLDNYVFATTSPVYVTIAEQRPRSHADAEYFLAWIERVRTSTTAYPDWNDASEKTHVLQQLDAARDVFMSLR
jgi:TolB protein